MSWLGKHPKRSRVEAYALKPWRCKLCRYFYRVFSIWRTSCGRCKQHKKARTL